jgi:hypothetical protein
MYERDWLFALLGDISTVSVEVIDETVVPTDCPIMVLQRPYVQQITALLKKWSDVGVKFKIIHLSDESSTEKFSDSLESYALPGCVSVLRFYVRNDFPPGTESKVNIIPLGYRWSALQLKQSPLTRTPQLPFRELHWSFHGTDWMGRSKQMAPLIETKLFNSHKFYKEWEDASGQSKSEYLSTLLNSIFIPCPGGINPETFRFYEALEAGCIPIVLKTRQNEAWFRWVSEHIPLVGITTWEDAVRIMISLLTKPEALEIYRNQILTSWVAWVNSLKRQATQWLMA